MHKVTEQITKGLRGLVIKTTEKIDSLQSKVRGTNKHYDNAHSLLVEEYKAKLAENERSRRAALRPLTDEIAEQQKIIAAYETAATQLEE